MEVIIPEEIKKRCKLYVPKRVKQGHPFPSVIISESQESIDLWESWLSLLGPCAYVNFTFDPLSKDIFVPELRCHKALCYGTDINYYLCDKHWNMLKDDLLAKPTMLQKIKRILRL